MTASKGYRSLLLTLAVVLLGLAFPLSVSALVDRRSQTSSNAMREERLRAVELDRGPTLVRDAVLTGRARALQLDRASRGWGGVYTTGAGERVRVTSSDGYAVDEAANQGVADFLAGLVHGPELALVGVYLAPPVEVRSICESAEADGCYFPDRQQIVVIGRDDPSGLTVESVLAHEYGHHVANNRLNPPWNAEDWGTKRWASVEKVCSRRLDGTAFPGDESGHYTANPGEGFAESYRVLNEMRAGGNSSPSWPVVSWSFFPTSAALDALYRDVTDPWQANAARSLTGRFTATGGSVRTFVVPTPNDGSGELDLSGPAGGALLLVLAGGGGLTNTVAARNGRRASLRFTVCGQRSLAITIVRLSGSGAFTVSASTP